uniref:Uncharacterized protein n=1 Tax=Sphaerodactylus townsendi TaxID=933632 RepID=A0ACB8GER3_9SAUR
MGATDWLLPALASGGGGTRLSRPPPNTEHRGRRHSWDLEHCVKACATLAVEPQELYVRKKGHHWTSYEWLS